MTHNSLIILQDIHVSKVNTTQARKCKQQVILKSKNMNPTFDQMLCYQLKAQVTEPDIIMHASIYQFINFISSIKKKNKFAASLMTDQPNNCIQVI